MGDTRAELLSAALTALESGGPEALRARRLTAQIGVSTMAVYTHFGGMPGLLDAMIREGFRRFAAHVRRVPTTDDPMTDLMAGGLAFGEFATTNPQLYRLMFGLANTPGTHDPAADVDAADTWQLPEGIDTFSILLEAVTRVIEAGDFSPQDPMAAAVQILGVTHGYILLRLGGFLTADLPDLIAPLSVNLMVGLGADRKKAERALERAVRNRAAIETAN
jgi:AcrR family transcriptional regulator